MKKTIFTIVLAGLIHLLNAQELKLELNPNSDAIEVGNKAWYSLVLTNNTGEDLILFNSPMSNYGVGGYEYTISCNGNQILYRVTRGLDTNEKFGEKRISSLSPGKSKTLLGFSFPLKEAGKYIINVTYYQDPSGLVEEWAENKKAKKIAKTITTYKVELNEEIVVK